MGMMVTFLPKLKDSLTSITTGQCPDKPFMQPIKPFFMLDIVDLISSTFKENKKSKEVKVLAVLGYMFHRSCGKVSKVLSTALEPISKSSVHELTRKVSVLKIASEPKERMCIAVDETELKIKGKLYLYRLLLTLTPKNC